MGGVGWYKERGGEEEERERKREKKGEGKRRKKRDRGREREGGRERFPYLKQQTLKR